MIAGSIRIIVRNELRQSQTIYELSNDSRFFQYLKTYGAVVSGKNVNGIRDHSL